MVSGYLRFDQIRPLKSKISKPKGKSNTYSCPKVPANYFRTKKSATADDIKAYRTIQFRKKAINGMNFKL